MTIAPWIQTQSGTAFPMLSPVAEDVTWRDIAISLGRVCRFNGHTTAFYSVAQHSMLAVGVVREAFAGKGRLSHLMTAAGDAADDVKAAIAKARHDDETHRRMLLATLLHDAHEAYIGDIATPVAQALELLAGCDHVGALKATIDRAIHAAAGLPWPLPAGWRTIIHAADLIALATEKRDLLTEGVSWQRKLPEAAAFRVKAWPEHLATDHFFGRLSGLLPVSGSVNNLFR